MRVIVGLGNPGSRYAGTRHNVGFDVIDLLAQSPRAGRFRSQFQAAVSEVLEEGDKLLLVKPETYMNLSGHCVRQLVDFYQLPLEHLLVIADDVNLPLGKLRVRARGSHGGHNGLRDIQQHLGTPEYARVRVGVGGPKQDLVDHVLGRFSASEQAVMADVIPLAAQAVVVWVARGIEPCMNQFNGSNG